MALGTYREQTNYVRLKLGDSNDIEKVTLYAHFYEKWYSSDDSCAESLSKFVGCTKNVNNSKVIVKRDNILVKDCGEIVVKSGTKRSDQIYEVSCANAVGNLVVISRVGKRLLVPEVVVSTGNNFR